MTAPPKLKAQIEDSTIRADLGDAVRDRVTGYSGVVTGITVFDHTSPRYLVESVADGEIKSEWIDAGRVDPES